MLGWIRRRWPCLLRKHLWIDARGTDKEAIEYRVLLVYLGKSCQRCGVFKVTSIETHREMSPAEYYLIVHRNGRSHLRVIK